MIKVDERKKLCLTAQRFIYNVNLMAVVGRQKESIETETTALFRQSQITYHGEKERTDTELDFFLVFCCISNMFVR